MLKKIMQESDLPNSIQLPALNKTFRIDYIPSDKNLTLIKRPHQEELVLMGKMKNSIQGKKLLLSFLRHESKAFLVKELEETSKQTALPFKKVTIRDQRSRWGSCSHQKSINLNYKLIFLPAHLIKHILIHELCHTVHLNHSPSFWNLVAHFDPRWEECKREIKKTNEFIPGWVI